MTHVFQITSLMIVTSDPSSHMWFKSSFLAVKHPVLIWPLVCSAGSKTFLLFTEIWFRWAEVGEP